MEGCKATSEKLTNIYKEASIETIHPKKIYQKVMKLQIMKREEEKLSAGTINSTTGKLRCKGKEKRKKKNGKVKTKIEDTLNKLFEIATVVPLIEKEFYEDQKTVRKMVIGKVDRKVTKILNEEILLKTKKEVKMLKKAENRASRK